MDGGRALVEDAKELVNAAPAINDGVEERAGVGHVAVSLGAHTVPEEGVVQVTTSIEADLSSEADGLLELTTSVELGLLLEQLVEIVHVGAMMLAVVELKSLAAHARLKSAELVRKVLKLDAH